MTSDALLLVGRDAGRSRAVLETHARRLVERDAVDDARVATYEVEPGRELRSQLAALDADRVFAVPTAMGHTMDTLGEVPALVSGAEAEVRYCEPLGRSPRLTQVLAERAAEAAPVEPRAAAAEAGAGTAAGTGAGTATGAGDAPLSIVLVGLGGGTPHARQVVEAHAARLRGRDDVAEVQACYLAQNPAVECARYNVGGECPVAVPVFLADCEATRERIPDKLELERGGLAYADPLGEHPLVTDAIEAELAKQRALASPSPEPVSFEDALVADATRMAADGEGRDGSR